MGFGRNVAGAFKEIANPENYTRLFHEGLNEIERPFKNLASGEMFKSLPNFGKGSIELPLQGLLGAAFLYPSISSRPDLDEAGPMEDMADRAKGLYTAAATMSPSVFGKYPIIPSILGLTGADIGLGWLARKAGRAADWAMGTRPSPMEMQERFIDRISPRATSLRSENPNLSEEQAMGTAAQELIQQVPEYADWLKDSQ